METTLPLFMACSGRRNCLYYGGAISISKVHAAESISISKVHAAESKDITACLR